MQNLDEANKLISTIASENNFFSPVTKEDFQLFQSFFQKEKHTYGNSWTYVTQGVYGIGPNNLGYKYYDGKNLSVVCVYPKIDNSKELMFYWIRPMGENVLDIIHETAKMILHKYNTKTYVKKIFQEQKDILIDKGFKNIDKYPWHPDVIAEDDTYPEQIIDIQHTINLLEQLKGKGKLQRAYQYYRHYSKLNTLKILNLSDCISDAKNVLNVFFHDQEVIRNKNISIPEDYYNLLVPQVDNITLSEMFYLNDLPVGFYYIEIQKDGYSSLYATITLRSYGNSFVDFVIFYILEKLEKLNIKFLNLGGSETKSLNDFKLKYRTSETKRMHWVVFNQ